MNSPAQNIIAFNNLRLAQRKELIHEHGSFVVEGPQGGRSREFLYTLMSEYVSVIYDTKKEQIVSIKMLHLNEVEVFIDSLDIKVI
jgi:hypothetical protein